MARKKSTPGVDEPAPVIARHPLTSLPEVRVRAVNTLPIREDGEFVLYWMTASRRLTSNFALQHAAELATRLGKPLLIFEPIGCRAPWNNDRIHTFVLQGMAEHADALAKSRVGYYPYAEPQPRAAKGLIESLAQRSCVVVTDDFPTYIVPAMTQALAERKLARVEAVDGNGLYPVHATQDPFPTAYAFRRHLQKTLAPHLSDVPALQPLQDLQFPAFDASLIANELKRWPVASQALLSAERAALAELPIDHRVGPAAFAGGRRAALRTLETFLRSRLDRYADDRNDPDNSAASELSPYLHFGHVGAHEVFTAVARREGWQKTDLAGTTSGSRAGWWGMSPAAESFLDELVTWREVGFNTCAHLPNYSEYHSLPEWARKTLEEHVSDPRPRLYTFEELEAAETYDEVWNAAQRQLVRDGRMHNYLRMLWGKKVLEWTPHPRQALEWLIELNNKYAVDGRDPNSYSGIFWVLGRYDRPWGPKREIFGTIRYMSSDNTVRKLKLTQYLQRYAAT